MQNEDKAKLQALQEAERLKEEARLAEKAKSQPIQAEDNFQIWEGKIRFRLPKDASDDKITSAFETQVRKAFVRNVVDYRIDKL